MPSAVPDEPVVLLFAASAIVGVKKTLRKIGNMIKIILDSFVFMVFLQISSF